MQKYLALIATLAMIAVNAAANIVPINGVNTGGVSARYPTGFTPAGWVFAIWALIYLGMVAFAIFAARVPAGRAGRVRGIEPAYLVSCLANAAWIFAWHYGRILESLLLMLVLLGSLLVVYVRLRATPASSMSERICVDMPFSLYFGWITTATLANLAAWFFDLGVYPFALPMDDWAILTVVTATAIYTAVGVRTRDVIYTSVFAWASLGIVLQTLATAHAVRLTAAAACAVMVVVSLISIIQSRLTTREGAPA
ncbi:MAG: tryptophan-rich sensory protein [Gammaproteobacteria bacterium]|nr:tryptophan-rich sensory protein [Gammaproteobacteria bacterium]